MLISESNLRSIIGSVINEIEDRDDNVKQIKKAFDFILQVLENDIDFRRTKFDFWIEDNGIKYYDIKYLRHDQETQPGSFNIKKSFIEKNK